MGTTITQRDAALADLVLCLDTVRKVELSGGIVDIHLMERSSQRQHLVFQNRDKHGRSMIGNRLTIALLATVLACLSLGSFFGSAHPGIDGVVLHNKRIALTEHSVCHLQMLQFSDFCLTAIQLSAFQLQRSVSLYFAILFPNQTHTSLDGAVRVVVLRIVCPAASVHLATYQVELVLYIIALISQFVKVNTFQGRSCDC